MSKGAIQPQEKKLYKNSECEICNCHDCIVKLKEHPLIKEYIIICRDCFAKLYKNKADR